MHRPHLYVCMAQFERVFACLLKLYAGIDWSHNSALVQKTHTKPITSLLMMAGYIFVPPPNQEPKNAWIAKKRHAVDNLLRRQAASTSQDSQANCGRALAAFLFSSEEKEQANFSPLGPNAVFISSRATIIDQVASQQPSYTNNDQTAVDSPSAS
ncbi:hypothetical protein PCANC_02169 [Puccinia coronata f. sp. avenae]|uniref:Uncharacterized protein n=1 Tax=Puccinia coronata f. sp. avenae TaxID=200324 RepID=A0A2N5VZX8_9BASI|nr:hypothetical protein PCANC_02169 [Puccinia coronata f. sp. avenae]